MNNQHLVARKTGRRVALLLAALIGFGLLTAGTVQAAGGGFFFGQWYLQLAFPGDEPLVELTTEVWYKPAGSAPYLVTAEVEELDCTVSGNLQINNEIAQFSGQESIACDQPDMVQKFEEVSQGVLNNVPYDVVVRKPFTTGQLMVAGAAAGQTLPAFYHPDMQYGLARTGVAQAEQLLRIDGAASRSNPFSQTAPYNLHAQFRIQPAGTYHARFSANGVTTSGNPAVLGSGLMLNLDATTVYFGFSPENGRYFQGQIKNLLVDPGAFGRG